MTYDVQAQLYSVKDMQVHTPPATLFTKLSDASRHGEDQSNFRRLIVATSRNESTQQGIEIGRTGLSIRGAAPVKDAQQKYVGSLEVMLSFGSVLQQIKTITSYEVAAFVRCDALKQIATSLPALEAERQIGGMCSVPGDSTDWDTTRKLVAPEMLRNLKDSASRSVNSDGAAYEVVLHPLLNFEGEDIGVIMASRDMSGLRQQARASLINIAALYLVQLIIVIGALLVAFNGLLLRPLDALSHNVAAIAKGAAAEDLHDLSKRADEIGELSRNVDAVTRTVRGGADQK